MSAESNQKVSRSPGWRVLAGLPGTAGLGVVAGWVLSPGRDATYLALQASSDAHHRFAVIVLPVCGALLFLGWLLLRWTRRRRRLRPGAWFVLLGSLLLGAADVSFIVHFDRRIEERGLVGQLVLHEVAPIPHDPSATTLGPFLEDASGPGVATDELGNGDVLTLDRRTLARKTPEGGFRWNRARPGRHPASVLVAGNLALFAGPGPDYEDDVVIAAVSIATGRRLWTYHCLGRALHPAPVRNGMVAFVAQRPSVSAVVLLRLDEPARIWSVLLPASVHLPPRPTGGGIAVAASDQLWQLDPADGRVSRRVSPCGQPDRWGVVCRQGKVVAWRRGDRR